MSCVCKEREAGTMGRENACSCFSAGKRWLGDRLSSGASKLRVPGKEGMNITAHSHCPQMEHFHGGG